MVVGRVGDVAPAEILEKGVKGVGMKVLISEMDGAPNFVLRVFDIEPGGHTPYHTHDWEHEIYVLEGTGAVKQGDEEHPLEKDSFALIVPGEEHQFLNKGDGVFRFTCVVPKL
jgi:quercetin dioxygenase-like cupin family protein